MEAMQAAYGSQAVSVYRKKIEIKKQTRTKIQERLTIWVSFFRNLRESS